MAPSKLKISFVFLAVTVCGVPGRSFAEFLPALSNPGNATDSYGAQAYGGRGAPDAVGTQDFNKKSLGARDKGPSISGKCSLSSELQIDIPCNEGTVVLYDEQRRQVGRTNFDRGTFFFQVQKNRPYFLSVRSKKYESEKAFLGPFKSDDLVLFKVRKKQIPAAE